MGEVNYVLAQVNFGRLLAPLDSPRLADFAAALEPVNALADAAPGFVWRLQTEDGNATAVGGFEEDATEVLLIAHLELDDEVPVAGHQGDGPDFGDLVELGHGL